MVNAPNPWRVLQRNINIKKINRPSNDTLSIPGWILLVEPQMKLNIRSVKNALKKM